MSLYNFLYNLQRKSYREKRRVLFGLLTISFIFLAVLWVFMFKNQVSRGTKSVSTSNLDEVSVLEEKMPGPTAALLEGFKGLKDDITRKIGEYKLKSDLKTNGETRSIHELPVN